MATKTKTDVKLVIVVLKDEAGNTANLSFQKIALDAADDELLTAGKAIAGLQTREAKGYKVNETYALAE